jgi:glycosyltransferase involved in cell wall biosynthesis
MHILFLTDNFPPEVNAPASRTFEHCREWVKAGCRVTVITCVPNFPKGEVYPGYRNRLWQAETMEGIRVIRVWSYVTANEGVVRRSLDYASYMASAVAAAAFVRGVDIVVATSPQLFTACAGRAVSVWKQVPFVFELRDLWPESIKAVGAVQGSGILRWLERLELHLYRKADAIVSVTRSFMDNLVGRGIEVDKISVITNGVDIARFTPQPKDAELVQRYRLEGKFVAGYVGTHGLAHALETILDAAHILERTPAGDRFRFILLGDGARKQHLKDNAARKALKTVHFLDSVPKDEVVRFWSLLDVSIIHLRRTETFRSVIPSKIFESMAMGLPILHGVEGESADLIEAEGAGLVFEPENAEALVRALVGLEGNKRLHDRLRLRCVNAAPKYDRRFLAERMLRVLRANAAQRSRQRSSKRSLVIRPHAPRVDDGLAAEPRRQNR